MEEGHSFLSPAFLHLFVAFLFFILEFVALWELRLRDHLRSLKVSFLTSCHMVCLILTSGDSRGTSLLTPGRVVCSSFILWSWPPSSELSSMSYPMIWALGFSLGIFSAVSLSQRVKKTVQDQRGSLSSWLGKLATSMEAARGWLDTGQRPIYSGWSFHHRTMLCLHLATDANSASTIAQACID